MKHTVYPLQTIRKQPWKQIYIYRSRYLLVVVYDSIRMLYKSLIQKGGLEGLEKAYLRKSFLFKTRRMIRRWLDKTWRTEIMCKSNEAEKIVVYSRKERSQACLELGEQARWCRRGPWGVLWQWSRNCSRVKRCHEGYAVCTSQKLNPALMIPSQCCFL